jgi:CRISPR-associated endonuclease/helicase Cas3
LNFATVAAKFRLIEDQATATIVVPYKDKATDHVEAIRHGGPTRDRFRALQPYTVRIYPQALRTLLERGAVEELAPGMLVLLPQYKNLYDPQFGLMTDDKSLALLLT